MRSDYSRRLTQQRAGNDADQAEYAAIRSGAAVVDEGVTDENVSGAMDDVEVAAEDMLDWHANDLRQDALVGDAREEIERRARVLSGSYPFVITQNAQLCHIPSASGFYEFCIGICNAPSLSEGVFVQLPQTFERRTAALVGAYMGWDSEHLHVGWPRDGGTSFKEAFANLTLRHYEWVWSPEEGMPDDPTSADQKDAGIDFVVTKKVLDGRAGRLYVLGQCACGNNWQSKIEAPDLTKVSRWFRTMTMVPPLKAFTTPFWLADEMLRDNTGHGLVFDRVRLTLIAEYIAGQPNSGWDSAKLRDLFRQTGQLAGG